MKVFPIAITIMALLMPLVLSMSQPSASTPTPEELPRSSTEQTSQSSQTSLSRNIKFEVSTFTKSKKPKDLVDIYFDDICWRGSETHQANEKKKVLRNLKRRMAMLSLRKFVNLACFCCCSVDSIERYQEGIKNSHSNIENGILRPRRRVGHEAQRESGSESSQVDDEHTRRIAHLEVSQSALQNSRRIARPHPRRIDLAISRQDDLEDSSSTSSSDSSTFEPVCCCKC